MKMFITVNFEFEGIHCWPDCHIPEVDFLKSPHRHTFYVKASKEVTHGDRQIEIIIFKRALKEFCESREANGDWKESSCEHIATDILIAFDLSGCEVLEDGENGARVVA